jgi:glutamyl-tRNA synthetase
VANYISLLGWSPKDNREFLTLGEIQELFALENINRRSAIFDLDKCFWLNGQHLLQMDIERFADLALPFIAQAGIAYGTREALLAALAIVKPKVKHLSDVPTWIDYLFTEDYAYDPAAVEKALRKPGALDRLAQLKAAFAELTEWNHPALEAKLKATAEAHGVKPGEFVHPARVAASGRGVGPGLYEMLEVLGKDRVLARFDRTLTQFA